MDHVAVGNNQVCGRYRPLESEAVPTNRTIVIGSIFHTGLVDATRSVRQSQQRMPQPCWHQQRSALLTAQFDRDVLSKLFARRGGGPAQVEQKVWTARR